MLPPTPNPPPAPARPQFSGEAYSSGPPKGTPSFSVPTKHFPSTSQSGTSKSETPAMPPPKPPASTRVLATPEKESVKRLFATPTSVSMSQDKLELSSVRGTPGSVRRQLRPPPKAQHSPRTASRTKFRLPPSRNMELSSRDANAQKTGNLVPASHMSIQSTALQTEDGDGETRSSPSFMIPKSPKDIVDETSDGGKDTLEAPKEEESKVQSPTQNLSVGLPKAWHIVHDESSGKSFFFNSTTNETTWERPGTAVLRQPTEVAAKHVPSVSSSLEETSKTMYETMAAPSSIVSDEQVDMGAFDDGSLRHSVVVTGLKGGDHASAPQQNKIIHQENKIDEFRDQKMINNRDFESDRNPENMATVVTENNDFGEWIPSLDPGSGRTYYFNPLTQETSWDPPPKKEPLVSIPNDADRLSENNGVNKTAKVNQNESEWSVVSDPSSGQIYYYNLTTKETTWKRPSSIQNMNFREEEEEEEKSMSDSDAAKITPSLHNLHQKVEEGPIRVESGETAIEESSISKENNELNDSFSLNTDVVGTQENKSTAQSSFPGGNLSENSEATVVGATVDDRPEATGSEVDGALTANWTEALDPTSGSKYYFNTVTMETTWDLPAEKVERFSCVDDQNSNHVGDGYDGEAEAVYGDQNSEADTSNGRKSTEEEIGSSEQSPESVIYASLPQTDLVTEAHSKSLKSVDFIKRESISSSVLVEMFDPSSGKPYYYNSTTGETTWHSPNDKKNGESLEDQLSSLNEESEAINQVKNILSEENNTVKEKIGENQKENDSLLYQPGDEGGCSNEGNPEDSSNEMTGMKNANGGILPPNWEIAIDPDHGDKFYYNNVTGETSWTKPVANILDDSFGDEISAPPLQVTKDGDVAMGESGVESSDMALTLGKYEENSLNGALESPSPLPEYWTEACDPSSGEIYYYNTLTQVTSWTRPRRVEDDGDHSPKVEPEPDFHYHVKETSQVPRADSDERLEKDSPEATDRQSLKGTTEQKAPQTFDWEEHVDPQNGVSYFCNESTEETRRKKPVAQEQDADSSAPEDEVATNTFVASVYLADKSPSDSISPVYTNHGADNVDQISTVAETEEEDEWEECVDPQSGATYYFNESTGETRWNKPTTKSDTSKKDGRGTLESESVVSKARIAHDSSGRSVPKSPAGDSKQAKAWIEAVDPASGDKYFVNEETGETSWENPFLTKEEPFKIGAHSRDTPNDSSSTGFSRNRENQGPLGDKGTQTDLHKSANMRVAEEIQKKESKEVEPEQVHNSARPPQASLPLGWTAVIDSTSGETYYYNTETEETSWECPSERTEAEPPKQQVLKGLSSDAWVQQVDPSTGEKYFYNTKDGTTSWELRTKENQVYEYDSHMTTTESSSAKSKTDDINLVLQNERKVHGITGALMLADEFDVVNYIDFKAKEEPGDLLWNLIQIGKKSKGRFRSDEGVGDESSPEFAIVELLLGSSQAAHMSKVARQSVRPKGAAGESSHERLEHLLLRGKRHEAVNEALSNEDYATAFLVASLCDRETYQRAVKQFAERELCRGTPLHTVALLFSGQLELTLGPSQTFEWGGTDEELLAKWRYHLAAIISNRTPGWDQIVLTLGDRLHNLKNIDAAHFCYMVCGSSVQNPLDPDTRVSLLGYDHRTDRQMFMQSEVSIAAYDRTEAYEWVKRQGNRNASIQSLQPYKLIYARRLFDLGRQEEARNICHSIRLCTQLEGGSPSKASSPTPISDTQLFENIQSLTAALTEMESRLQNGKATVGKVEERVIPSSSDNRLGQNQPPRLQETETSQQKHSRHDKIAKDSCGLSPSVPGTLEPSRDSDILHQEANNDTFISATSNLLDATGYSLDSPRESGTHQRQYELQSTVSLRAKSEEMEHPADEKVLPSKPNLPEPQNTPTNASNGTPNVASKPPAPPMSAPAVMLGNKDNTSKSSKKDKQAPSSEKSWGFGLRGRIIKYLNPDAHEVKLEESEEKAYYDEKLKRWVFPGDNLEELAKPLAPPPTTPSSEKKAEDKPSENSSSQDTPIDPLAMMMAPPKRAPSSLKRSVGAPNPNSVPSNPYATNAGTAPPAFAVFKPKA